MFAFRRAFACPVPAARRSMARSFSTTNIGGSSSSSNDTSSSSTANETPDDAATVIQGPSLLTSTGIHRPSPSLFHLPGLRSLPFWTAPPSSGSAPQRSRIAYSDPTMTSIVDQLESSFEDIKAEYMSAVIGSGTTTDPDTDSVQKPLEPDYDVNTRGGEHASDSLHTGSWDWHSYVLNGQRQEAFARHCPKTASIIDDLRDAGHLFETPFSFAFFSTLQGQSSIKPHVGPMNMRLRIHLPLIVPPGKECGLRVGSQTRQWEEGKALVLDDSYEHEVYNKTDSVRVLLLLDVWHPDVAAIERERIRNMFTFAKDKGWIGSSS